MKSLLGFVLIFASVVICNAQEAAIEVGDIAPAFTGVDQSGQTIDSKTLLKDGDIVLVFYRGAWCGYCKRHLSEFQTSLEAITTKGASVIAVAPETAVSAKKMIENTGATFAVLSDGDQAIMKAFGVDYILDAEMQKKYDTYGINLSEINGNDDNMLPVPATYVIGQNGKVKWAHFDPDYSKRASIEEILEQL